MSTIVELQNPFENKTEMNTDSQTVRNNETISWGNNIGYIYYTNPFSDFISLNNVVGGSQNLGLTLNNTSGLVTTNRAGRDIINEPEKKFTEDLLIVLKQFPIELGESHPADKILHHALMRYPNEAQNWIYAIFRKSLKNDPGLAASLLRSMSRIYLNRKLINQWGYSMAKRALLSNDIDIRDAAIRALETWRGSKAVELLQSHLNTSRDAELNDYILQVINDLT